MEHGPHGLLVFLAFGVSLVFSTCHHLLIAIGKTLRDTKFRFIFIGRKNKKDMKLTLRLKEKGPNFDFTVRQAKSKRVYRRHIP